MGYKKAADVLSSELVLQIQDYIDGEYIYIPRKQCNRKTWGEKNGSKNMLFYRNLEIYIRYRKGESIKHLSKIYYLSPKTIQKILSKVK